MVGHDDVFMKDHVALPYISGVQPFVLYDLSLFVQNHFVINNTAEITMSAFCANGDEIKSIIGIIMSF